jgi:3-oxoacyl-[acyl-carrier protein] reductase
MSVDLSGKAVLVTGGSSGIGLATVERFARGGAAVALNYRPNRARGADAVARLSSEGLQVIGAPGDVSVAGEAERMVQDAIGRLGGLDVLVNNAGTPGTDLPIDLSNFDAITEPFWEVLLSTNLVGPFRCTRAAADALRARRGAIVNTASVAGLNVVGSSIAYGAGKAGLINLTRNLARALAPEVRVNAVAPGLVDSPWTAGWPDERKAPVVARTPLRRMCTPDDIAAAIFFLAVEGSMITGQTLVVDGGLSL